MVNKSVEPQSRNIFPNINNMNSVNNKNQNNNQENNNDYNIKGDIVKKPLNKSNFKKIYKTNNLALKKINNLNLSAQNIEKLKKIKKNGNIEEKRQDDSNNNNSHILINDIIEENKMEIKIPEESTYRRNMGKLYFNFHRYS